MDQNRLLEMLNMPAHLLPQYITQTMGAAGASLPEPYAAAPLGHEAMNHTADVSAMKGAVLPQLLGGGWPQTEQAGNIRNLLLQRMQRGESLPPGLLD